MGIPTGDLNGAFWITIGGIVSALLGVFVKSMYQSKCSEVDLCCIKIKRNIDAEVQEDLATNSLASNNLASNKQSVSTNNLESNRRITRMSV